MESPTEKALKVAVIGPKGQCGSCVVDELLKRGHSVVGISRNPPVSWKENEAYSAEKVDIYNHEQLTKAFSGGYDAIVSAYAPPLADMKAVYYRGVECHVKIKAAMLESTHNNPFIIIGGAGSLFSDRGVQLCDESGFAYEHWYQWPSAHLEYMKIRIASHGMSSFSRFIGMFLWARNNVENPGWLSWVLRPFARLFLRRARSILTNPDTLGLITSCRVAYSLWQGVTAKPWSFLSPPWLLRDQGVRTGKYEIFLDNLPPNKDGEQQGIYNEDMAVAIVDEVENNNLNYKHWTCAGPINLGKWYKERKSSL